jgi:hypothetical protein
MLVEKSCIASLEIGLTVLVEPGTGRTSLGNRSDRFVPNVSTCLGGVCICAGGALVCFCCLCSLLELAFDSVLTVNFCQPRVLVIHWFRL